MSRLIVHPGHTLQGSARVPGDKSLSHRVLMLGALAEGTSRIEGFLPGGDCRATLECVRALGIPIEQPEPETVIIHGRGLHGLQAPAAPLNCVRSGTTMRLLAGILAGQAFDSVLTGDVQLLRRPMRRITGPLRAMGAAIRDTDGHGPLAVHGRTLRGTEHRLRVASAQVKSAILLAGLFAEGPTVIHECGPARDHTERVLMAQISASTSTTPLTCENGVITLVPAHIEHLEPLAMVVPGDVSSAAFPLVATLLLPHSKITLAGVGVNPTRTGLLDVLAAMGADVTAVHAQEQGGEPLADLRVRSTPLVGTEIGGAAVVRMIDEFPILAVAATQAQGETVVRDARELRVKETDRIATVVTELRKLGAQIESHDDGFVVEGPTQLHGTIVDSHGDHRLGMALAVAGLVAYGNTVVEHAECIADSFPGFESVMAQLGAQLTHET